MSNKEQYWTGWYNALDWALGELKELRYDRPASETYIDDVIEKFEESLRQVEKE